MIKDGTRRLSLFAAVLLLAGAAVSHAAEIKGQVKEVSGNTITIQIEGDLAPRPGDPVSVMLDHPALGTIKVGVWTVKEVDHPTVRATLRQATGAAEPRMQAVIVSPNPVEVGKKISKSDPLEAEFQAALAWSGRANDHPVDRKRAFEMFTNLAGRGHAQSMAYLGLMYGRGEGTRPDQVQAVRWYRKAADGGVAWAGVNLGRQYELGRGISKDEQEAVRWYRKAVAAGERRGFYYLARMYHDGRGVGRDHAEALRLYRMAAAKNYAQAMDEIGMMYQRGQGVKRDYAEAMRWYRQASERGNADARNNIGFLYRDGLGVTRDYAEASKWFRLAANGGNAHAMFNLGFLHAHGYGVAKDIAAAESWFVRAGKRSRRYHLNNIAAAYEKGARGLPRDRDLAIHLYRRSAAAGDAKARERLRSLGVDQGR